MKELLKRILAGAKRALVREPAAAEAPPRSAAAHGHGPRRPTQAADRAQAEAERRQARGDRPRPAGAKDRGRGGRGRGDRHGQRRPGHEVEGHLPDATHPSAAAHSPAPHHGPAEAPAPVARRGKMPVQPSRIPTEVPPVPPPLAEDSPFRALALPELVLHGVSGAGYKDPTPIQLQAIPVVLSGKDLIGSAQTGTGKTAAFVLPVLAKLGQPGRLRCLILEPTRELAQQVEDNLAKLAPWTGLRYAAFYGGVSYGPQREHLARGMDILVATPGRLLDHMEQGAISLGSIEVLILDEVDRMLDMGFIPQVRRVVRACPKERQTLLFSATVPDEIGRLADWVLRDPVKIEIGIKRSVADTITHALYPVEVGQKFDLLLALLAKAEFKSVLVFCRTKVGSDRIYEWLRAQGHAVGVMHADRTQAQRMEALEGFKSGKYEVLVATDIAARGLDIAGVTHVINYDIPENPEDYVHRIGRTGRAHREGDACTLVTWQDLSAVSAIERFLGREVERRRLEGFEYTNYPEMGKISSGPVAVKSVLVRGRR